MATPSPMAIRSWWVWWLARAGARGWDSEELDRREAHQLSLPVKKQRCTYTIQNDGAIAATEQQVETLLRTLGAEF